VLLNCCFCCPTGKKRQIVDTARASKRAKITLADMEDDDDEDDSEDDDVSRLPFGCKF